MDAVLDIAQRHGLRVLEDACQAWGAEWRGQRVGALGDLGAFSFQSGKNITAGEGGIVVTNDEALHAKCWSLHNVGRVPQGEWYEHRTLGWNLRMTEWQGGVLLAQLDKLPEATRHRDESARVLTELLREVGGLTPARRDERTTRHAWHLFVSRYDPVAFGGRSREEFIAAMRAEGIPAAPGYTLLTESPAIRQTMARMFGPESLASLNACPETRRACADAVWLGQNVLLGDRADMESIAQAVAKIRRAWA
jgi:dTDP-4-amino-4,6-dideoxygalactose transaminase